MRKRKHPSPATIEKMRLAHLGKHHTPEAREKMHQAHLGEKNHFFGKQHTPATIEKIRQAHLGENNPNFGKHLSPTTKEKMRRARLGTHHTPAAIEKMRQVHLGTHHTPATIEKMSGEKSHTWQGGISFEPYPTSWTENLKECIRQRDHYTCQLCDAKQEELKRRLSVHHIDYDKKNLDPENLISLCLSCHLKTNYNRERWKMVFQSKKE